MAAFICTACGTQHAPSGSPPAACPICTDERQYVPFSGQGWTTLDRLRLGHMPTFRDDCGILGIGMSPHFAIGQRALLVRTPHGNVLWDCISLVDDVMVELIRGIGGLTALAISHPHYYTTMVEWSHAFGGIPVHLHAADRQWVMRPDPCLDFWDGEAKAIGSGLTLVRAGGHYAGGTVLHWADSAGGRGALLSGDILQVVADRKHVGFMRSYPNFIPLGAAAVLAIRDRIAPYPFDAVYGAFWHAVIPQDGKQRVQASVERHIASLERPEE
ncbi:MBL fold metallo-hydrolase [Enterovirga aerilata]|uniref:MBL fold metallo-hydrolase n=1 Tax=Enterovirga aerilata TaxID=2730920 RepID=A0A849I6B8_9HYPH|nr:MBL fold metallo-hydrolase [Enterovirga sp. DB1703]NNM72928.1 MBL fold metallo-hydrolase [Enterovirga sp. DB1703]